MKTRSVCVRPCTSEARAPDSLHTPRGLSAPCDGATPGGEENQKQGTLEAKRHKQWSSDRIDLLRKPQTAPHLAGRQTSGRGARTPPARDRSLRNRQDAGRQWPASPLTRRHFTQRSHATLTLKIQNVIIPELQFNISFLQQKTEHSRSQLDLAGPRPCALTSPT